MDFLNLVLNPASGFLATKPFLEFVCYLFNRTPVQKATYSTLFFNRMKASCISILLNLK